MAKTKGELMDDLVRTAELISDAMDDLEVPHIFITLKTVAPSGVYFCNGGTFLQSLFLALTVLVKTIESQPPLRPILKTLWGVLNDIQKKNDGGREKQPPGSPAAGMIELNEALKEIFGQAEEKQSP